MNRTLFLVTVLAMAGACADDDKPAIRLNVRDVEVTTAEDTALTVQLQVDANRPVQASITTPPTHGELIDLGSSTYSYTPDANYFGPDTIAITFNNGMTTVVGTAHITVTPVDDEPLANPDSFAAGFAATLTTPTSALLANDTDVENDPLTVTSVTQLTNGTVTLSGNNVVFVPAANFQGEATYAYRVSDGTMSTLGTVTVTVGANTAPVAVDDTRTGTEDTNVVIQASALLANDTDGDNQTLVLTGVTNPTHGTVALVDTTITFIPDPNYNGPATFDYTATDGAASDPATVTINLGAVNDPPLAVADSGFVGTEDAPFVFSKADLVTNDSDVDGDNLTITSVGNAQNCTVSLPASLVGDTVLMIPTPNFNGTASFTYTISDGTMTATATVSVTVGSVNDAPIATDDVASGAEDTVIAISAAALLANDTDADGQPLAVTAVSGATNGTVALSGGAITFTPPTNFNGTGSFNYTVSDGTTTDVGTVTVTVTPVNDAPDAIDDAVATPEDVALSIQVLLNDLDLDGDALAIMSTTQPLHGTVVVTNDVAVYTPTANYQGPDSFTYVARDAGGLTDTALVTISVTSTNDAPVAVNDVASTLEDTAITIDAVFNDTDADGDTLVVSTAGAAAHGSTQVVNGQVLYTPELDYNGTDSFTYTASDANGGQATATVTITVGPVNDAPVAVNDGYVVNDTLSMVAPGVLGNDTDVDSTVLTVSLVTAPQTGTLVLNADGSFSFVSDDCSPTETFTYVVSDGLTTSNVATVTLTINHRPVAYDDSYRTTAGTALQVPYSFGVDPYVTTIYGVLENDVDRDPQPLSSQIASLPMHAQSFTLNPDGSFTYVPEVGFTGCDSFTYTAADQTTVSSPATVYITVDQINTVIAHGGIQCGPQTSTTDVASQAMLDAIFIAITIKPRCCYYEGPYGGPSNEEVYGCEYSPANALDGADVSETSEILTR